ncbi:CHRD domain-containing protein [Paenibacillus endoradicis]|uniref:CHRD domain-containing protein n=1 Tax=Paenibacillus endoradicis TaxID=2972487 RepID=UPI002158B3D3|nr:CHRD domain-containing protein [Paenibacillus endoradicis]MCR8659907.1 CHRD domain-containing protein [Paenibacillus endoradicis]
MIYISKFIAKLRGFHEVPRVRTNAKGIAFFISKHWHNHLKLKFLVKVENIRNVTKIDLHLGERGHNGPVVATLFESSKCKKSVHRKIFRGVLTRKDLEGPLRGLSLRFLLREIRNHNVYVNVHTKQHPNGEIRGQIKSIERPRS